MQHLSTASASLARFHQLAFTDNPLLPSQSHAPPQSRPSLLPSSAEKTPLLPTNIPVYDDDAPTSHTECFQKPIETSSNTEAIDQMRQTLSASLAEDGECCGGFIDCSGLAEDEPHVAAEDVWSNPLVNNSNIRSTSDGAPTL